MVSIAPANPFNKHQSRRFRLFFVPIASKNTDLDLIKILTSRGMDEQFRLLVHFLSRKLREYEMLRKEIAVINQELVQRGGLRLEKQEDF